MSALMSWSSVPRATHVLLLVFLAIGVQSLSLDEIHSTSPSSFSNRVQTSRDNTLRDALDSVRRRRQDFTRTSPEEPYFYKDKRMLPFPIKRQLEEVMEVPLDYEEEPLVYDYYDVLASRQEAPKSNLFSASLARKISQLLERAEEEEMRAPQAGPETSTLRKRVLVKRNNSPKSTGLKRGTYALVSGDQREGGLSGKEGSRGTSSFNKHGNLIASNEALKGSQTEKSKANNIKSSSRVLENHYKTTEALSRGQGQGQWQGQGKGKAVLRSQVTPTTSAIPKSTVNPKNQTKSVETGAGKGGTPGHDMNSKNKPLEKRKTAPGDYHGTEPSITGGRSQLVKPKPRETTGKQVMARLNSILEPSHGMEANKRKAKRNAKKSSRGQLRKRSNDLDDSLALDDDNLVLPAASETEPAGEAFNREDQFADWLRNEYYRNLARSIATMRRKRSQDYVDEEDKNENDVDIDEGAFDENTLSDENNEGQVVEEERLGESLVAAEEPEVKGENNNEDNDARVVNEDKVAEEANGEDQDDDYLVAASSEDQKDEEEEDENRDGQDMGEKKRKRKRSVSLTPFFGNIDDKRSLEVRESLDRFNDVDSKLERIQEALAAEALQIISHGARSGLQKDVDKSKIENRIDAAYDLEAMRLALNDLHKTMEKMEDEPSTGAGEEQEEDDQERTIAVIPLRLDSKPKEERRSDTLNPICPALELLTSDCYAVRDVAPSGHLKKMLTEACNWHEVCYTCGEAFGLLASDCDAGFLESSRISCKDSPSCETAARLVLTPLRERRVFYKRKVPGLCFTHQCVSDYLSLLSKRR